MTEVFLEHGFRVLRIECSAYSSAEYPTAQSITDSDLTDVRAALYWLKDRYPDAHQLWIAGTGFGAYISMQMLLRDARITGFVAVGLPCLRYDFNFLSPCPARGVILSGSDAEEAPSKAVIKFVEDRNNSSAYSGSCMSAPIDLIEIPGTINQAADEHTRSVFSKKLSEYVKRFHTLSR
jgi:alpha/beta superfamily hydrolase